MTDHASQRAIIDASPEQCFEVASNFASYPEWASDIKHAEVQRLDDDGRGGDVTFRAAAMGRSTTYTLRYYYGSNPLRIAWKQLEGDITSKLDGEYEFLTVGDNPAQTEVVYHLEALLVVPIPGFVKRRAESRIIRTALEDLRQRVEATVTT
jgi:ribosome-associated toxin RatA of RatAB toxin-antitoxin module